MTTVVLPEAKHASCSGALLAPSPSLSEAFLGGLDLFAAVRLRSRMLSSA